MITGRNTKLGVRVANPNHAGPIPICPKLTKLAGQDGVRTGKGQASKANSVFPRGALTDTTRHPEEAARAWGETRHTRGTQLEGFTQLPLQQWAPGAPRSFSL